MIGKLPALIIITAGFSLARQTGIGDLFNHANFGTYQTAQNTDLAYAARMLQFAGRIEF